MCAAALVVTVLPAACTSAHAEQTTDTGQEPFPVGAISQGDRGQGNGDAAAGDGRGDNKNDKGNGDNAANADNGGGGRNSNGGDNKTGDNAGDNKAGDNKAGDNKAGDNAGDNKAGGGNAGGNGNAKNAADKGNAGGNAGGKAGGDAVVPPGGKDGNNNGLDVLGRDCSKSKLPPHTGFQESPRCVDTAFGEIAAADKSPSLLITDSPQSVKAGENFTISVTTRNLVRDRFLGAAAGGYYLESSFLNDQGLQRGHFHTACRMLDSVDTAPDSSRDPEFFLATQDNGGGATPDTVKITVTGMPRAGTAQCAVWAGDGSHRVPMMERANQTPAFDAVRVTVQ
jgi:hypothetical protein